MGNEVSIRTKKALVAGIEAAKSVLDKSNEKEETDFLTGVPTIVDAARRDKLNAEFTPRIVNLQGSIFWGLTIIYIRTKF